MTSYKDRLAAAILKGHAKQQAKHDRQTADTKERKRKGRPEASIGRKISRELEKEHGIVVFRRTTGMFMTMDGRQRVYIGQPGEADYWCCVRGRHVDIETKSAVGRQSEKQKKYQTLIEGQGGLYVLARSVTDVYEALADAGLMEGQGNG